MVTACKGAFVDIKILQNRMQSARRRFFEEPIKSIEIPAKCWIIKKRYKNHFIVGTNGNQPESILIFSSETKAVAFLIDVGEPLCKYVILPITWRKLVIKFGKTFRYARLDESYSEEFTLLLPLR